MGRKPNKTAIGAFVLGAILLSVAALLIFGAGRFFTKEFMFITYFQGSVKGLKVGSPVMFRGVKVGSVTDISIVVDPSVRGVKIPVLFTLEPGKFRGTRAEMQRDPKAVRQVVVEEGLRTQLQSMSILTGQLMVSLDFFPGKPVQFAGLQTKYPEIPSIPTPLEELQKTVENLPFREMVNNLNNMLEGIDRLVQSIDPKETVQSVQAAIRDVRTLVRHVDAKIDPLLVDMARTAGAAESTLGETRETMAVARGSMKEVAQSARGTLESAQASLKQAQETLRSYSADSRVATDLTRTLRDISATARSLRQLADYLERNPESVLRGKPGAGGE